MKRLRIAQVAPLNESVPPKAYGGTERVVSYLTEELVQQGHAVTLFASGDSITQAQLVPVCPQALRLDPDCVDQLAHHIVLLEQVFKHPSRFDIIHFHIDYLHFPWSRRMAVPHLTTLHGRLNIPDVVPLYQEFREMPLVSISNDQRTPLPWLNFQGTVYHGLPEDLLTFHTHPERYLAFLGRISPEKGIEQAIQIARQSGMALKIAAKVDPVDQAYFDELIQSLLDEGGAEFIGEIGEDEKDAFLGNAYALLFPIEWPEPFGLVMIEALACGTPVIAFRHGSVPEVIDDGVTGFIVDDLEGAVRAVERVAALSRTHCREIFEERFTAARMAQSYLAIYRWLIGSTTWQARAGDGEAVWPESEVLM